MGIGGRKTGFIISKIRASRPFASGRSIVFLLCGAIALAIFCVGLTLASYENIEYFSSAGRNARDSVDEAKDLLSSVNQAELLQHGYILTGDRAYLDAFLAEEKNPLKSLAKLRAITGAPTASETLGGMEILIAQKLRQLETGIDLRRNNAFDAAIAQTTGKTNQQLTVSLNSKIHDFSNLENSFLNDQRKLRQSSSQYLLFGLLASGALATLLVLAGAVLTQRSNTKLINHAKFLEATRDKDPLEEKNKMLHVTNKILDRNRKQLLAFVHDAPVSMAIFDVEMNYLAVSEEWMKNYGEGRANIIGLNHYELHPDMPTRWRDFHQQGLAGVSLRNKEDSWIKGDAVSWLRWALQPWINDEGNIGGIIIATEDITERKKAEKRSIESEQRLRGLIDAAMDAIVTIDDAFNIVLFNPAASYMFRVSADEAIGRNIAEFMPEAFRAQYLGKIRAFGRSGSATVRAVRLDDVFGLRQGGEQFPVEAAVSRIDFNGKTMITAIVRDMTERLKAREEVRAGQIFSAAILNSVGSEIAVLNRDGMIVAVNEAWTNFARKSGLDEQLAKSHAGIGADYLAACKATEEFAVQAHDGITRVLDGRLPVFTLIYPCDTPSRKRWFSMVVTPMAIAPGGAVVSHTEDTARVEAELALQQSHGKLRDMIAHQEHVKEEERIRVARDIHDELGSALTAVKANLSVALVQKESPGGAASRYLEDAGKLLDTAIESLRRIIIDLRPSVLDTLGIWTALEWYAEQLEARTGIEMSFDIEHGLEDVEVDAERSTALFRIFQEALTNVMRHAQATMVNIHVYRMDATVIMEVEDNGVGIDDMPKEGSDSWGIAGMVERVRFFGGNIRLANTGHGTLLALRMPLEKQHA